MTRSESIKEIAAALLKAQQAMGEAKKSATNPFFSSAYADLNAVRAAVLPALNANSITVLQPTVVIDGRNYVETVLLHSSGEFLTSQTEIKVKDATNPQAEGSGISYARRYGLQSFLNVGAADDDGNTATGVAKATETKAAPKAKAAKDTFKKAAKETTNGTGAVSSPLSDLGENGDWS